MPVLPSPLRTPMGLVNLLQQLVNIAGKHGRFGVKDVLYGRNAISSFCKERAAENKCLRLALVEPQEAESASLTVDIWTDDYMHMSYSDAHVFWIDPAFEMKHHVLAVRNFGTERHTAENIAKAVQDILI